MYVCMLYSYIATLKFKQVNHLGLNIYVTCFDKTYHLATHTMAKNSFHCQQIAPSIK